jgi:hypothetical protein
MAGGSPIAYHLATAQPRPVQERNFIAQLSPMAMSRTALILVLALAAAHLGPAAANPLTPWLAIAGLASPTVSGDCPWASAATKCACIWSYGILNSRNKKGTFDGPRMTLDDSKTQFVYGDFCQVSWTANAGGLGAPGLSVAILALLRGGRDSRRCLLAETRW